tara:strand:+ start:8103 stop:8594 length:492 start_codon:yes stop_codon:yes gene_type:complete
MAEYTADQVSISTGSKAVVIESNESPENVRQGDFLFIEGNDPVAINRTYINSDNKHVIELRKAWPHASANTRTAILLPTTYEFRTATDALKNANTLINDNTQTMQDWQTKEGEVTFNNIDGTQTTVKTLKQMELDFYAMLETLANHIPSESGQFTWREQFVWG